jgi:diguanylate cyclase (GGDEF)-like protein/PAS domain S-box-containing protein
VSKHAAESVSRRKRTAYLLALALTGVVIAVRYSLVSLVGDEAPLLLFIIPITAAAWWGGLQPGLLATALAMGCGIYFFIEHTGLWIHHPIDQIRVATLLAVGGSVSGACEAFHCQIAKTRSLEASLRLSQEQLLQAVQKMAIPTLLHAEDGEILVVSDAWTDITGFRPEDIPTIRDWTARAFGPRHEAVTNFIGSLFESSQRRDHGEWTVTAKDGEERIWHFFTTPIAHAPGGRRLLLSNAVDLTGRRLAEDRLRESEQWHRVLTNLSPQSVWTWRADGYLEYCNQYWCKYSGMTLEETQGHGWVRAIRADLQEQVFCVWLNATQNEAEYEIEIPLRRASDGAYRWHLAKGLPIRDEAGKISKWVGIAVDIHDHRHVQQLEEYRARLEEANARLAMLAATDGLTRLKNRRAFQEQLTHEVERAAREALPLSLLLLDVDRFKQFNDEFGHPAGDRVLRDVARVLEESARSTDFVARYGGEEFAILLPNSNEDDAEVIGERFRRAVRDRWRESAITISVGAATLAPGADGVTLVAEADAALYAAKGSGRNCVRHARQLPCREEELCAAGTRELLESCTH